MFLLYIDITVHPQSVNTTLNSTVSFICEAFADLIDLQINNTSTDIVFLSKEFIQQFPYTLSGSKVRRVLLAKALKDNNNTNISCTAYGFSSKCIQ